MTRLWLLVIVALIASCTPPDMTSFKEALEVRVRNQSTMHPLPTLRPIEPDAFNAAKLADPFYPK